MSTEIHAIAFVAYRTGNTTDGIILFDNNDLRIAAATQLPCSGQPGRACANNNDTFFTFFHRIVGICVL